MAKRLPIPIFHVNAEDPDAAVRVARWAVEYRYKFHSDVVVDLIGYRRHGHSEIDDPTTTQPVRYRRIAALPPVWESYARRHQTDAAPRVAEIRGELEAALKRARTIRKNPAAPPASLLLGRVSGRPLRPGAGSGNGGARGRVKRHRRVDGARSVRLLHSSQSEKAAGPARADDAGPPAD